MNSIPKSSWEEPISLSFSQQKLWFLDQLAGGKNATYNVPFALGILGPLNVDTLRRSLNEIRRRHESLRNRFVHRGGDAEQVIDEPSPFPFHEVDPSNHSDSESALEEALTELGHKHFDLANGPLLRSTLVCLALEEHVLIVVVHNIVTDGWSMGVFEQELGTIYYAFLEGRSSPLPELRIQYVDYTEWQRQLLQGDKMEEFRV